MKYLLLPIHLLKFWYIESLTFFGRVWKNSIYYLEEDLAVGLMWRLLFVPLFRDSTIVGFVISFFFRLFRIGLGLFAFALVTVLVFLAAVFWLFLPIAVIWGIVGSEFHRNSSGDIWEIAGLLALFSGAGLFVIHTVTHPHKKVWEKPQNLWDCSWIKQKDVVTQKLLLKEEVKNLLAYLEITKEVIATPMNIGGGNLDNISNLAFDLAKKSGSPYIDAAHFIVAIIKQTPNIEDQLIKQDLSLEDFEMALTYLEKKNNFWRLHYPWDSDFAVHHLRGINRGWLGTPTPTLDSVSKDLTKLAGVGFANFIGRGSVVSELINILSLDENRNVCLVGAPGVGKSALINYLAKQILSGDAPPALSTKRVVSLDSTALLSGIRTEGELADRVKAIFQEINRADNIILVIEEIHNLGIGEAGNVYNLYSLLQPYLDTSAFQFIVTTEPENYSRIIERNGVFARLFTKIELPAASPAETITILEEKAIEIERRKKLQVSYKAIKKIVVLVSQYIKNRVLPDSAIAVLLEAETEAERGWVTVKTVESILAKRVNVPVADLGTADKDKLLNLAEKIHRRFIDQFEAVKTVTDTLIRGATGLREKSRPIGSFLFVGPTGVGKTELAKILSEEYFSNSSSSQARSEVLDSPTRFAQTVENLRPLDLRSTNNFFRFDMSEYQDPFASQKLIGAAGQPGELTELVRNKPYCLILLDEFEKANSEILNLFLQVLDDGRLTDGLGQTIDFTNTIIIATSNVGSLTISNEISAKTNWELISAKVSDELLKIFKPELVNRFDAIVLFKPLSEEDMAKIVLLSLTKLQNQLLEQGYKVTFSQDLITELAKKGFDPTLGARPLRRLIQNTIESNLSKMILENQLVKGETFQIGVEML